MATMRKAFAIGLIGIAVLLDGQTEVSKPQAKGCQCTMTQSTDARALLAAVDAAADSINSIRSRLEIERVRQSGSSRTLQERIVVGNSSYVATLDGDGHIVEELLTTNGQTYVRSEGEGDWAIPKPSGDLMATLKQGERRRSQIIYGIDLNAIKNPAVELRSSNQTVIRGELYTDLPEPPIPFSTSAMSNVALSGTISLSIIPSSSVITETVIDAHSPLTGGSFKVVITYHDHDQLDELPVVEPT